jgi:hypothetical protein
MCFTVSYHYSTYYLYGCSQVAWLVHVARSPPTPKGSGLPTGGPDAFRLIPDWVLSDLLAWLTFVIQR